MLHDAVAGRHGVVRFALYVSAAHEDVGLCIDSEALLMASRASQLPHLLRLLDDDTPDVRGAVLTALLDLGADLKAEAIRAGITLSDDQCRSIETLLAAHARQRLVEQWPSWQAATSEHGRLETAQAMIADFLSRRNDGKRLPAMLDRLSESFLSTRATPHPLALAEYLFKDCGLHGNVDDYYNPENSNLVRVLVTGRGIPISLVSIYLLIGARLGLEVRGCNFPGHFLAIARTSQGEFLVDCFNGGRTVNEERLALLASPLEPTVHDVLALECDSSVIVSRVLRNILGALVRKSSPPFAAETSAVREDMTVLTGLLRSLGESRSSRQNPPL